MAKYTRKLEFSPKVRKRIKERDHGACIFCEMGYTTEGATGMDLIPCDIMHFVPRSSLGLGIEQNGALGCRYHHNLLDNGNKGLRPDMLRRFESYLRRCYPDWDKSKLVYNKFAYLIHKREF